MTGNLDRSLMHKCEDALSCPASFVQAFSAMQRPELGWQLYTQGGDQQAIFLQYDSNILFIYIYRLQRMYVQGPAMGVHVQLHGVVECCRLCWHGAHVVSKLNPVGNPVFMGLQNHPISVATPQPKTVAFPSRCRGLCDYLFCSA